jgi:hypothetical protein
MQTPFILRDADNNLLEALNDDPHSTMHALMNRFDSDHLYTGRLAIAADILFGEIGESSNSLLIRSAFFAGGAVVRQTLREATTLRPMERGKILARARHVPIAQELLMSTSQDASLEYVMGLADRRLAEQPNLEELADVLGTYYASTYSDGQSRLRTSEYDAARMGVGYNVDIYTRAAQFKIQI